MAGPFDIVGGAVQFGANRRAQKKLRRARKLERSAALLRNLQRRRTFIRSARAAQAANIVSASGQGAGFLDSSAFQGTQASIATQEAVGLSEFDTLSLLQNESSQLRDQASQQIEFGQRAANITSIANAGVGLAS